MKRICFYLIKKFYIEAEQNFALEEMVDQVISDVKADLQNNEMHDTFLFVYEKRRSKRTICL